MGSGKALKSSDYLQFISKREEIEKLIVILKSKLKECKLIAYKIALRNHDKLAKCDKKWNKVKTLLQLKSVLQENLCFDTFHCIINC